MDFTSSQRRTLRKPATDETKEKIRQGLRRATEEGKMTTRAANAAAATRANPRKHTDATKAKLSATMRSIAASNPEQYRGTYTRGHTKMHVCKNDMNVIGSWEAEFVHYCMDHLIVVEQPTIPFSYEYDGVRSYYPDFYLPTFDLLIEIKGMQTERDLAKWEAVVNTHHKRLMVVKLESFNQIKKRAIEPKELFVKLYKPPFA
jgi:hypothetical protein